MNGARSISLRLPQLTAAWFWASLAALSAATVHTGQSIFFSSGVPGNLGDARLVNCILEHVYQWMQGSTELFSPSQFYPVHGTLTYSDGHFGTVAFYAILRVCGASMETAFQGWFLIVVAANTGALLYLLRRLNISPLLAAPLAFFGTSSSALVFKTSHPQTLPFFALIMALSFLLQFLREADARPLGWAMLWFGYQHACYFYHGYFALIIFGAVIAVFLTCYARRAWWNEVLTSIRRHWIRLVTCMLLAVGLLVFLYYPYIIFASRAGTRPMEELVALAPNLGAWFSASPSSGLYAGQIFYKPGANVIESTLFAGWLIWGLIAVALGCAFRRTASPDLRLAGVLALAALLIMAGITTWSGSTGNFYLWLAERIPPLRTFRAFTRIAYPLIALETVSAALLLNHFARAHRPFWLRGLAIICAFAMAGETVAFGQEFYPKAVARERVLALVAMWNKAGARDILVFAPGYTNQPLAFVHTDCWYAALANHKWTVNGYSGNMPPRFAPFLGAPTVENADALIKGYDLPLDQISLVTDWEPALREKLGIRKYELAQPLRPITTIRELTMTPSAEIDIHTELQFKGATELPCDTLNVFASYRIYDAAGAPVTRPASIRTPVHTVKPGSSPLNMRLVAPSQPGRYRVEFSMVHEGVAWWADFGLAGSVVTLIVEGE